TETGGGTSMALFEGISADSTEQLSETWCGDLLQIVDNLPEDYELIDCCFAEVWYRASFCYRMFGVDTSNYLLGDKNGKRYKCANLNFWAKRGPEHYIKIELTDDVIRYIGELIPEIADAPMMA
ncbi:MAG: hypothetical protein LBQ58_05810, partial [Synergistaceae bacterium]|nr:hypothetical protein [Synergistaceae bacterium]